MEAETAMIAVSASCSTGLLNETIVTAKVSDCSCKTCCDGQGQALCAVQLDKLCYCNVYCRTSTSYNCCNNETICDSGTIIPIPLKLNTPLSQDGL